MAKLDPNSLVGQFRGKVGDLVFVPATDGTVLVNHAPRSQGRFHRSLCSFPMNCSHPSAAVGAQHKAALRSWKDGS